MATQVNDLIWIASNSHLPQYCPLLKFDISNETEFEYDVTYRRAFHSHEGMAFMSDRIHDDFNAHSELKNNESPCKGNDIVRTMYWLSKQHIPVLQI